MARPIEEPADGQDKTFTFTLASADWRELMTYIVEEEKRIGYRLTVSDALRRIVRNTLQGWKEKTP